MAESRVGRQGGWRDGSPFTHRGVSGWRPLLSTVTGTLPPPPPHTHFAACLPHQLNGYARGACHNSESTLSEFGLCLVSPACAQGLQPTVLQVDI